MEDDLKVVRSALERLRALDDDAVLEAALDKAEAKLVTVVFGDIGPIVATIDPDVMTRSELEIAVRRIHTEAVKLIDDRKVHEAFVKVATKLAVKPAGVAFMSHRGDDPFVDKIWSRWSVAARKTTIKSFRCERSVFIVHVSDVRASGAPLTGKIVHAGAKLKMTASLLQGQALVVASPKQERAWTTAKSELQ